MKSIRQMANARDDLPVHARSIYAYSRRVAKSVNNYCVTIGQLYFILGCIAVSIFWLIFRHNINWDEFHYLSKVHQYVNGEQLVALQTFHVHLFRWITLLPIDEIGQVSISRVTTLFLVLCTAALVYAIARSFVEKYYALFGSLAFLTSGFIVGHGASFRPDPIAASLLMLALYIAFSSRLNVWQIFLMSLSMAMAGLITIKAVLFAPAFLAALVYRYGEPRLLAKVTLTAVSTVLIVSILYLVHQSLLVTNDHNAANLAKNAVRTTVLSGEVMPRLETIRMWIALSVGSLFLIFSGFVGVNRRLLICLLLVSPIFSLLFYRNAYPYFFPFISPPMMIVAAIGAYNLSRLRGLLSVATVVMCVSAGGQVWVSAKEDQQAQKELLAVVHELFVEPVPYIDRNSMISTFPKVGFFMSTWGVESYRRANNPIFADIISSRSPPFMITNGSVLRAAMRGPEEFSRCCGLLEDDVAVLRDNYVHYWRELWLAGKTLKASKVTQDFEILIAGEYRISSEEPAVIDGEWVESGQPLFLSAGRHEISALNAHELLLVWNAPLPPESVRLWPQIYYGFWRL